ncbi:hypothetical protein ACFE04_016510 [Oxalis oulophora]
MVVVESGEREESEGIDGSVWSERLLCKLKGNDDNDDVALSEGGGGGELGTIDFSPVKQVTASQIINNYAGTNILSTSHDPAELARDDEGGIRAVTVKQCACSPTSHPGSFRCRQHHADYVWAFRLSNK